MPTTSQLRRARGERGAALVEFAIVANVLFLIVFAIIEFGWAFGQHLDVRHGAREAARLAAVNYKESPVNASTQTAQIVAEACSRMDLVDDGGIELTRTGNAVGQTLVVDVERDLDTLTGFLDFALGGITLGSRVEMRIEQEADWAATTDHAPC